MDMDMDRFMRIAANVAMPMASTSKIEAILQTSPASKGMTHGESTLTININGKQITARMPAGNDRDADPEWIIESNATISGFVLDRLITALSDSF